MPRTLQTRPVSGAQNTVSNLEDDLFHFNESYCEKEYIEAYPDRVAEYIFLAHKEINRLKLKCGEEINKKYVHDEDEYYNEDDICENCGNPYEDCYCEREEPGW